MVKALLTCRPLFTQSLPLDCLGLAKSAALVRISDERTALVLTLGASQPDTMLPPGCPPPVGAPTQEDVAAGEVTLGDAVRATGLFAEADVRGAAVRSQRISADT